MLASLRLVTNAATLRIIASRAASEADEDRETGPDIETIVEFADAFAACVFISSLLILSALAGRLVLFNICIFANAMKASKKEKRPKNRRRRHFVDAASTGMDKYGIAAFAWPGIVFGMA